MLAANELGDAIFIFAGDAQGRDAYREDLEQQIEAAGLAGRARLVGHCDDIVAAFALAKVAVVASATAETFGRTSIESQAMGCPVIVTDVGAAPENVIAAPSPNFTGWVVPPADSAALATAIRNALALSEDERAALGLRAHGHAAAQFNLQKMQRATLMVYDELLDSNLAERFL